MTKSMPRWFLAATACAFVCDIVLLVSWWRDRGAASRELEVSVQRVVTVQPPEVAVISEVSSSTDANVAEESGTADEKLSRLLQYPVSLPLPQFVKSFPCLTPDMEICDFFADVLSISNAERSKLNDLIKTVVAAINDDEVAASQLFKLPGNDECVELKTSQGVELLASLAEKSTAILGEERSSVFMEVLGKPLLGFPESGFRRQVSMTEFKYNGMDRRNLDLRFVRESGQLLFGYELPLDGRFRAPSPEFRRYSGILQKYFPAAIAPQ